MYNPIATYRIQFHKGFNFNDFEKVITYLQDLGVKTIYASPILASAAGSMHGYDGVDPERINPEIGTEEEFKRIVSLLKANGVGWLQDIVPNHMAFDMANKWIWDVLENGPDSEYASFFDIDQRNDLAGNKLMVPFLNEPLDDLISNGDLKIELSGDKPLLQCLGVYYPLNSKSIKLIEDINDVNNNSILLNEIVEQQFYRLCQWQETDKVINYRRFFTINGLICLNIQNDEVYDRYHLLIKKLVCEGLIDGLRVDHIDGLYDPKSYLDELRKMAGEGSYIVVEKILAAGEQLRSDWSVQGTTGYDFLAVVNNLFTNAAAKKKFDKFYRNFSGDDIDVQKQIQDKKAHILYGHMRGELANLLTLFKSSELMNDAEYSKATDEEVEFAIGEFLIRCPVYKYYGAHFPLSKEEEANVRTILDSIELHKPELSIAVSLLRQVFTENPYHRDKAYRDRVLHLYRRCMQFTGPLMAKGVEDTLMYTYNCFIGHNDVGDAPDAFGISIDEFHHFMIERQNNWPLAMNATSTHDTKRGEDARARLAVITDLADDWIRSVRQWHTLVDSAKSIDRGDEYFIYQSLIGVYPMQGDKDNVEERMHAYLEKSLREAKRHSNWVVPDLEYENKVKDFLSSLLGNESFHGPLREFFNRIVDHGILNSLAQLILKFTCPGIPDIYQGTELWDLSLVDPDNRRPVDYKQRSDILNSIKSDDIDLRKLWDDRYSGKVKLWLTHKMLSVRIRYKDVFRYGIYSPIEVKGRYHKNIIAFARVYQKQWCITICALHTAQLCSSQNCTPIDIDWLNTKLVLPEHAPVNWIGFTDNKEFKQVNEIKISDAFSEVPFTLLRSVKSDTQRHAGVLAAVTSLPSNYGMGDIGPAAYKFVDFLVRSCQTYWQLLPVNPISAASSYSPYSSISAMAGNILLISPELLVDEGLLDVEDLEIGVLPSTNEVDHKAAERLKCQIFEKAYGRFIKGDLLQLETKLEQFCNVEAYWLDEFSTFVALKKHLNDAAWYDWPDRYKFRDADTLRDFKEQHKEDIDRVVWYQFIFWLQWKKLRNYCDTRGVTLFGDMPFYVSYDSADVWANQEFFSLDDEGKMTGVAGVPPDYFSEDGQLWGMPTFNWQKLKADGYSWWVKRLKRNLELFDLVRLDHFRAFAEYWEVPAGENTARNGKWMPGPGKEFFDLVETEIGGLPFVAEDLGDNMDAVYGLRDEVGLPGMKVLQFAFGEDMASSVDAPHNYPENCIVYTGTHDNNTSLGWFNHETKKEDRRRLQEYAGCKVTENNVHTVLSRLAYASVAKMVILPLQDIIGLNEENRMNTPGSNEHNWLWRFTEDQLTPELEKQLRDLTKLYGRY